MPVPFKEEVIFTEQPASGYVRFRHKTERLCYARIPGVNSGRQTTSHATLRILDYVGSATARISCVSIDEPYRPHPYQIVGLNCKDGIMLRKFQPDMTLPLSDMVIRKLYVNEFSQALVLREMEDVDPFNTGFAHKYQPRTIDVRGVRLGVQVYLEDDEGYCVRPIASIVSEPIRDRNFMFDPPRIC